jgi:ribosomal protein S6--L-glutamate ligase
MNILILSTGKPSKHLIDAITKRGHTYECYAPDELYLFVSDSMAGYDRLYAENGEATPKRLHLKNIDAVITRLGGGGEYGLSVLQHLTDNIGIYSAQTAHGIRIASNKVWTSQKVSVAGLRSPITVFAKNPENISFLIDKVGGLPCVVKTPYGSQGTGVIKVENYQQTKATLELLHSRGIDTLLQQYIEGGGKDYRVIVVGEKVVCVMERSSADGFKANLSQSGKGKKVILSKEHEEFCVKASKAIGLDFSGVDIMISNKDSRAYLIEINSNPGTKSIDICNHNWFEDWIKFIESKNPKRLASNTPDLSTKDSTMWYNVGYKEGINGYTCNIPTNEAKGDIAKSNYVLGWELGRKSIQK